MAHLDIANESYGIIARALHWLVAVFVLVQFGLGLYAASLPVSLARLQWLSRHKSLGLAILALMILRLGWRSMNRPPPLPDRMPRWERRAAVTTHWLLYLLLIVAPLTGWLHASTAGLSVNWFGVVEIPDLLPKNPELSELFKQTHRFCVALLALLLVGHVGAALRHAFLLRDGVLQRMLPWNSSETIG
jgi:cytochrome b561